jgi:hypothetical protein
MVTNNDGDIAHGRGRQMCTDRAVGVAHLRHRVRTNRTHDESALQSRQLGAKVGAVMG